VSEEKRRVFEERFIGQELKGVIVRKDARGAEVLTSNYISARLEACSGRPGGEVRIRITRAALRRAAAEETV
jgi:hypothetical protein